MSYLNTMRSRLQATGGSAGDATIHTSIIATNSSFTDSLGYTKAILDGVEIDTVIQSGNLPDTRVVLLRPQSTATLGQYIDFDNAKWLVTDFAPHDVFPKMAVQRCNEILRWRDVGGNIIEYPCVLNANSTMYRFGVIHDRYMSIVNNEYHVFVKNTGDTNTIIESFRFVFGSKAFVVSAVDDVTATINGVGIIRFHIKADLKRRETDDFVLKIADNSQILPPENGGGDNPW